MTEPEEDFAAMLKPPSRRDASSGEKREGTIFAICRTWPSSTSAARASRHRTRRTERRQRRAQVAVGDRIQAVVVSTEGGLTLSRKLARGAATARQLEDAFRAGLPVEGKVEKAVKGGYEVRIARQRAFCPFSQIDVIRNTTPADDEGRVYAFRIIEDKEGGKNLIVSRRALLEEEQLLRAAESARRSWSAPC